MPAVATAAAVAIKTVVGTALTTVGVGATTAYGVGSAVGAALTSGGFLLSLAGAALTALTPTVDSAGSPTEWRSDPNAPIPFIIGERGVAPFIVHRDEWGTDNRYQSIVSVYSGAGPIQAFGTYTADEAPLTFSGSYGRQSTGTWKDIFWRDTKLGAQPDTALQSPDQKGDPTIGGTMPQWGTAYKLSGKACDIITMAMDKARERWPGGEPRPLQVIQGLKVWDPREDDTYPGGAGDCRLDDPSTWIYSENPYLHALKWCLGYYENGVLVGGIGAAQSGIDVAAFVEGANVAEANGWTVSGRPTTDDDKHQVLQAMLQAGGGRYARKGGKISCIVRTPRASIVTVTAADTAGPFSIDTNSDRLARLNTVTPRCVMESHRWEMVAQDPVTVSAYVTADGGVREDGFEYPYVAIKSDNSNQHQPAQLAAYDLVDSREPIRGTVPLKPYMAQIEPGDVFTIDEPGFLLDGVECLCVQRSFDPAGDIVQITFVSETDGKHEFALGLDPTPPTGPSLTAPDIYTQAAPGVSAWDATASSGSNPAVVVTGEADDETVRAVRVEVRPYLDPSDDLPWDDDDSGWRVVGEYQPGTTEVDITGLEPSTQYQAAVSYLSQFGVLGDRRILATVTTGTMVADDATAPTAAINATRDAINDAQGRADATLEEAAAALAESASTSLQDSLLNWIEDPTGSDGWLADDGGFIIGKTTGFRAFWPTLDSGEQTTKVLWFPNRKNVQPGVLVQAGVQITVEDAATSLALEAVWYDSAGDVLSTDELDSGASGRLSGVEAAPASAAAVQFRLVPTASSAANGGLTVSEPFSAFARPDQVAADAYQDPTSEVISRILNIERSFGAMAGSVRQTLTENRRARAVITTTYATQVSQDSAIAALESSLLSTVAGTYLSQASAASTYATIAYTDSAVSTAQATLEASIAGVSATVTTNAGAITDLETGAAYWETVVEATGSNPALIGIYAGKDGSLVNLAGDALYFFTTVGGTSIKAMEVVSGDVRISNDLYVDNELIMDAAGAMRGGASDYLTGTGFFLGYSGGAYKLGVGDPSGHHMGWDGSALTMTGDITIAFGASGAINIGDLGSGRSGFEILNASGVEAFYADDTGALRLNGDALPTTRSGTEPVSPRPGEWWFDTGNDINYRWNGATWDNWGTIGGTWGDNIASIPANLSSLTGSEGILNTGVSIGSDGALAGGGGGQVTISGLGYSGDLNATYGAAWGSTLTGRPTELTDGRIAAGLDASGDLNRNITSSRATASDLLRRSGGGLFTGDLASTAGATWGSDVASIPTNLAGLVGTEGILNNAISSVDADSSNLLRRTGGGLFSGDTNATYGAAWGSNLSGRPANLASLAGTEGILNGSISSADASSSNLLRRTGGGLFSGDLAATAGATWGTDITNQPAALADINAGEGSKLSGIAAGATVGADWTSNLSNRPTELTDGRISTGLNASGILQTAIPNASQIPTLTLAKVSDAGAMAAKASVATTDIDADAVTNADSTTATGIRSTSPFTTYTLVTHTQTLTAGSRALITMVINPAEILSSPALGFNFSAPSGNRDVVLVLVRDPSGTPVDLVEFDMALFIGTTPIAPPLYGWSDIYEDTGHGGGSVTYALEMRSYTSGTTTLNSTTMAHGNVRRTIQVLETKR